MRAIHFTYVTKTNDCRPLKAKEGEMKKSAIALCLCMMLVFLVAFKCEPRKPEPKYECRSKEDSPMPCYTEQRCRDVCGGEWVKERIGGGDPPR
jgi:hypothetical protein